MPESAIPETKTRASSLNDETLAQLDSDPSRVSNLSTKDKYALVDRLSAGDAEDAPAPAPVEDPKSPQVDPEAPAPTQADEKTEPEEAKSEDDSEDKPLRNKDRRYWKEKYQQAEAERNTEKQRREAVQRRLDNIQKIEDDVKATKADKTLDPYDDADLRTWADKVAKLEKEVTLLRETSRDSAKRELEDVEKNLAKREEETVFSAIGRLQSEFEDLKTEEPFEKLNSQYSQWLDRLVDVSGFKERNPTLSVAELRGMAHELYESDEDFRREAIAKRAKPPKELDKIETILTVHEKRTKDGGGYRANYLDLLAERGILPDVIAKREREAALKASNATVDAIQRGNKGTKQLSPTDGSSSFPTAAPAEKMQTWLKDLNARVQRGHRMSADEKAQALGFMELLSTGE